ncbi:hypothetical protein G7092_13830 [Mucilaginibacter sp. HC2]|uniref:hypothetical protein n=1 Tax=Mucilaginibacter inviolabilis TaxID=2714892 RepID=UPI0014090797|nr:hypothetical protein [Mucilaginibacter inviolabilis]NHA04886.1 hypothetical protein [Mucilaginibacter inviolabilis]
MSKSKVLLPLSTTFYHQKVFNIFGGYFAIHIKTKKTTSNGSEPIELVQTNYVVCTKQNVTIRNNIASKQLSHQAKLIGHKARRGIVLFKEYTKLMGEKSG